MKRIKQKYGIYASINAFNILQMPIHLVNLSLINKITFSPTLSHELTNQGFLWFKDLSATDPTGILPIMCGVLMFFNVYGSNAAASNSALLRKFRKYIFLLPVFYVPIQMTFPAAYNIYWLITSLCQMIYVNLVKVRWARRIFGLSDFLPGSKLEVLNQIRVNPYSEEKYSQPLSSS